MKAIRLLIWNLLFNFVIAFLSIGLYDTIVDSTTFIERVLVGALSIILVRITLEEMNIVKYG